MIKEVIESNTEQARSEFARVANEVANKTSLLLAQIGKGMTQIITETETDIKAEFERLTSVIAETEEKLLAPGEPDNIETEESPPTPGEEAAAEVPVSTDKPEGEVEEGEDGRLFEGRLKLEMINPFNQTQTGGVPERLARIRGIKTISTDVYSRSSKRITAYTIKIEQPTPLLKILKSIPAVTEVVEDKGNIVITLK